MRGTASGVNGRGEVTTCSHVSWELLAGPRCRDVLTHGSSHPKTLLHQPRQAVNAEREQAAAITKGSRSDPPHRWAWPDRSPGSRGDPDGSPYDFIGLSGVSAQTAHWPPAVWEPSWEPTQLDPTGPRGLLWKRQPDLPARLACCGPPWMLLVHPRISRLGFESLRAR
jgi:hypothetical protein